VLDASECPPTFGSDPRQVQGIIAGGEQAMFRAQEGAEDSPEPGAEAMTAHGVRSGDVVVGIAASGTTPFVRGAVGRARDLGATTVFLACTPIDDNFAATVDYRIIVVTGPEIVTGSTRLKAGTATKMVLNMITTGANIRIGKTWGNLMVDLQATNAKLQDRSERILMEVCELDRTDARTLLQAATGHVKTAIVMHALGIDQRAAQVALDGAGGVIRRLLNEGRAP
jgi:N-acetylmuramic acid 6-phosphate etherase